MRFRDLDNTEEKKVWMKNGTHSRKREGGRGGRGRERGRGGRGQTSLIIHRFDVKRNKPLGGREREEEGD